MHAELFSPWTRWDLRTLLPQRSGAGVYILGQFESLPPENLDPTDERIVLIAETHSQTLEQRWYQFERSATKGADGHAGGYTFWKLFGENNETPIPGWLCVAATAAPAGSDAKSHVQRLKSELLTHFKERHGVLPCCNTRGPAQADFSAAAGTLGNDMRTEIAENVSLKILDPSKATFSAWIPWSKRKELARRDAAGVYALAVFESNPPEVTDVLDQSVVYLGETCNNGLRGRLDQFHRSAFQGKDGHSGGWTYRARFRDQGEHLYVSAFPVTEIAEPYRSSYIRYMERHILWHYVHRWGRRPQCNSK
jgi:hypothetical protein